MQKEQRLHCQRTAGPHFARSKKQFSKEENDPLSSIFPWASSQLLHLVKPGSQGQKYQYNPQSFKRKDHLPKCQGEKEHSSPAISRAGDNSCSQAICNDASFSSNAT